MALMRTRRTVSWAFLVALQRLRSIDGLARETLAAQAPGPRQGLVEQDIDLLHFPHAGKIEECVRISLALLSCLPPMHLLMTCYCSIWNYRVSKSC